MVNHVNSYRCVGLYAKNMLSAALEFAKDQKLAENKQCSSYHIEVCDFKTEKYKTYIVEIQTKITVKCKKVI